MHAGSDRISVALQHRKDCPSSIARISCSVASDHISRPLRQRTIRLLEFGAGLPCTWMGQCSACFCSLAYVIGWVDMYMCHIMCQDKSSSKSHYRLQQYSRGGIAV